MPHFYAKHRQGSLKYELQFTAPFTEMVWMLGKSKWASKYNTLSLDVLYWLPCGDSEDQHKESV